MATASTRIWLRKPADDRDMAIRPLEKQGRAVEAWYHAEAHTPGGVVRYKTVAAREDELERDVCRKKLKVNGRYGEAYVVEAREKADREIEAAGWSRYRNWRMISSVGGHEENKILVQKVSKELACWISTAGAQFEEREQSWCITRKRRRLCRHDARKVQRRHSCFKGTQSRNERRINRRKYRNKNERQSARFETRREEASQVRKANGRAKQPADK